MKKLKPEQTINIDSWICPWCKNEVADNSDLDLHKGDDSAICPHCGKESIIRFSIEYLAEPIAEGE